MGREDTQLSTMVAEGYKTAKNIADAVRNCLPEKYRDRLFDMADNMAFDSDNLEDVFMRNMLSNIFMKVDELVSDIDYISGPVSDVYEFREADFDRKFYLGDNVLCCGSIVEVLLPDDVYGERWVISSVEGRNKKNNRTNIFVPEYYLTAAPDLDMEGLKGRTRREDRGSERGVFEFRKAFRDKHYYLGDQKLSSGSKVEAYLPAGDRCKWVSCKVTERNGDYCLDIGKGIKMDGVCGRIPK